ncbi:MAG: response regulator [Thiotrichaceae bacterium]|nr:response regulator [Thiotrichaceae bacterium]PCI13918.1 MAG: hypothetical protein COB71_04435 [Thiotrichales bacterium]
MISENTEAGRITVKINLLLIEDSSDDMVLITEYLRSDGFDVNCKMICSEIELREELESTSWDVIVCDHFMPGFSSSRALEVLYEDEPEIPLLVVSGMIDEKFAVESLKMGAFDYVMKDNLARLPSAIKNAMTAFDLVRKQKVANEEIASSRHLLRRLAAHSQNLREEERGRFARDLHDDLGSGMAALKMDLKWLLKRLDGQDPEADEKLSGMTRLIDSAIASVRHVITEMRPSIIDDLGLLAAVEWQLEEFGKRHGIKVALDRNCDEIVFKNKDKDSDISIFRIFQEALNNIAKHAESTSVLVTVIDEDDVLIITISDDGCGFDVSARTNNDSFGIISMKERVLVMAGNIDVISNPGDGVVVKISLPRGVL